ncbi:MAG: hypothetical protein IJW45_06240 [Oscillospiraceae bacterium]|nr:hypothetical protein [Oscillospiraceae bacterium]
MKSIIISIILLMTMVIPVDAYASTAPEAPDPALEYMPVEQHSFSEDLWYVIRSALEALEPEISGCMAKCLAVTAAVIMVSILGNFPGTSGLVTELSGSVVVGILLLDGSGALIDAAAQTIQSMSDYGKLLLPAMASALAAQGGITSSIALYTGTVVFDAVLCGLVSGVMIPIVYVFLALSVGKCALGDETIGRLQKLSKWSVTWILKIILYVFTGYMTVTGVVSGSTDQSVLKATKLTISGVVPVVGGILSDASEAVLVSAGAVKNTIGVYGTVAMIAIAIGPFFSIALQYLLLKATSAICATFGLKRTTSLIEDIHDAMGLLLAMTGAVCFMLLISTVCFMKGVA